MRNSMRNPQQAQYSRFVQARGSERLEEARVAPVRSDSDLHAATATRAGTAISGARAIDINPVVDITTGESHADEGAALLVPRGRPKVAVAGHVEVFARHGNVLPRFVGFPLFPPRPRWPAFRRRRSSYLKPPVGRKSDLAACFQRRGCLSPGSRCCGQFRRHLYTSNCWQSNPAQASTRSASRVRCFVARCPSCR